MRRLTVGLVAAATLLTACGGSPQADQSTTPSPTPTAYPTASPAPYAGPSGSGEYAELRLSATGLGPIRLGLDADEGRAHGWVARLDHCDRWGASPDLRAEGVDLVFNDSDQLAEIWLGNSLHPTDEGARVGMAVEEVAYVYGDRLEFNQRDSVGGSVVVPFVPSGEHELVFYAIGDENETPGPRAPISAIGAMARGGDIQRPRC
ncbi:hypothetical protein [Granulicoccus sp. GXG6511]|uniref:hypothetical protein n=1 Tax=Granulicoccus sp. GXG6511 TaxID=3381351 RepID=UPI003D7C911F